MADEKKSEEQDTAASAASAGSAIVRILLTVCLLVGVYGETGKWTTISLALAMAAIEINSFLIRRR